jgi:hypothetical protein
VPNTSHHRYGSCFHQECLNYEDSTVEREKPSTPLNVLILDPESFWDVWSLLYIVPKLQNRLYVHPFHYQCLKYGRF